MLKIQKGVPIPPKLSGVEAKYPWAKMKVGDSFLVNPKKKESFRNMVSAVGKRMKMKFTTREVGDKSLRCWRIK